MRNLKTRTTDARGFSLMEMLISSLVMLIVLGEAMTAFNHAVRANETVTLLADSNQALRSGTQFLVRDLRQAGWGSDAIRRGIPVPTGGGAVPINRPGPPSTSYTFDPTLGVIPAVAPGASLGPAVSGDATDIITIMYKDNTLPADDIAVTVADDGSTMTVPAGVQILEGDLILFTSSVGSAMQEVTRVDAGTVFFETTDPSKLNQRAAPAGTILQLQSTSGAWQVDPDTGEQIEPTATRVKMISYYLDDTTDPDAPRLVRQENYRTPRAMAGAMDDLQITFDLVDGVTNPTNVANPTDPGPNQIRKVNLEVGVRSEHLSQQQKKYVRNRVTTQVSLRSLAFVDRYE